jgi:hypothetical protein
MGGHRSPKFGWAILLVTVRMKFEALKKEPPRLDGCRRVSVVLGHSSLGPKFDLPDWAKLAPFFGVSSLARVRVADVGRRGSATHARTLSSSFHSIQSLTLAGLFSPDS